ncbi:RluA family pseudouridine synthase [Nostoc sp. FACHB-110]|uniref:RluA family pseudouridine synthase n=1 Tax=Nostoc sp. FACHB-110 TaxID=2692834 RepID=UPI001683EA21|nr:RluA family pseudouridine synthase [Nostoc sp. FACHB-110]MBD2438471.1 RluA family pseudouridine synthase [Nostoc sp. FACHB-110]
MENQQLNHLFPATLHPLADFIDSNVALNSSFISYSYEGRCPHTGELLRLPRTILVEAIAVSLMKHLASDEGYACEGKMYGVLLVELPSGEQRIIKAFSGLLNSQSLVAGWVPPIPGRENVAVEEVQTLAQLEAIKQELISLQQLPERQQYEILAVEFQQKLQAMSARHNQQKNQRQEQRRLLCETLTGEALSSTLAQLDEASRREGIERRQYKRQRDAVLKPLQHIIAKADARIQELKQERKALSRHLQAQMHAAYSLMNFFGQSLSLQQLMPNGLPTGTGDCCAPKLLHYAATHHLKPLAMAEFWWGASSGDKVQGEFYGACVERCQPLMGFLLSGIGQGIEQEAIIYQDEWLIAVDKPAGLLSVPGRYHKTQDSVLSRLRCGLGDSELMAVHRLDQDTSGILLIARDRQTYKQLSQQFQQRQVNKIYEAILAGFMTTKEGLIELPLWGDPENRPYQQVNWQYGKPSLTRFRVISPEGNYTRVEFTPLTGRTHQLRVHAAVGLGIVILGDRLYGCCANVSRLHLHARELIFPHPYLAKALHLQTKTPF